ncbi:MAG: hypothetical protein NDJ89_09650 [Oligoflexia bacterium]|nr:hypothetical protein [Oligoflexia bacterium]
MVRRRVGFAPLIFAPLVLVAPILAYAGTAFDEFIGVYSVKSVKCLSDGREQSCTYTGIKIAPDSQCKGYLSFCEQVADFGACSCLDEYDYMQDGFGARAFLKEKEGWALRKYEYKDKELTITESHSMKRESDGSYSLVVEGVANRGNENISFQRRYSVERK